MPAASTGLVPPAIREPARTRPGGPHWLVWFRIERGSVKDGKSTSRAPVAVRPRLRSREQIVYTLRITYT